MKLTRDQFYLLTYVEKNKDLPTPSRRGDRCAYSSDIYGSTLKDLRTMGFLDGNRISENGLQALEPYRVKRAVFLAAGLGERLRPVTLDTPKPLIRIHGVRIIDTLLDAVIAAGISDIVIVRGYLGAQFDRLLEKYPSVRLMDNPDYRKGNNILSLNLAGDFLPGAYVFDSDLFLKNPGLITKYQYESNYVGLPVEETDDWCLLTDPQDNRVVKMQLGGRHCHLMYGLSYWTEPDGRRLAGQLSKALSLPGGNQYYWDQVALDLFPEEYRIAVRECGRDDILEIDSLDELAALDPGACKIPPPPPCGPHKPLSPRSSFLNSAAESPECFHP